MQAELNTRFTTPASKINIGFSSPEEDGNYEVCIANISPAERRKRLRFGIIQFAISFVIFAALLFFGADRYWRLVLYLPLAAAFSGYFQWRDKT